MPVSALLSHFRSHPQDAPYRRCPECGGPLLSFDFARHVGEVAFLCPACEWNWSVTDLAAAVGREPGGDLVYLDGDNVVTIHGNGVKVTADVSRVV